MYRILFCALLIPNLVFAQGQTLYKNAALIFPERSEVLPNGYLVVDDGHFVEVGQGEPSLKLSESVETVDLRGNYVSAGFIDTHAHINLGAVSYEVANETMVLKADNSLDIARWNGQQLLKAGVTSIRNPGGDTATNIAYREAQTLGKVAGPRAFVAGSIINTEAFDGLVDIVSDEDDIIATVDRQAAMGVDFIKLYTGLGEEQIKVAIKRAKQHNLPVIAHLEEVSWTQGVNLGIDHLVHAMPISSELLTAKAGDAYIKAKRPGSVSWYQWYQYMELNSEPMRELFRELVAQNTAVDPTLIVFYNAFFADQESVTDTTMLQQAYPGNLKNWRDFYHFNIGWQEKDYQNAQRTWPKVLEFVKQLHEQGVLLSVGTDLGNPWVIPGESFHQEMELLASAGIPPMQVLKLATVNGAKVLHRENELGRLENGWRADFVVFSSDPTQDISNVRDIVAVYQSGERAH
ncbi:amidohydrolase family protein [Kangiella shandongensis]|uniref:amidohydrolase family protein n=1 Tax=Kangiella shandongensis TaxID=2763258 RepID=UPI001CBDAF61|nr:amidohydrolase family protein [Kangiella shandongensis]